MEKIAPYYKAVAGALIAFLSAIATALDTDGISSSEWITAAIALIAGGGVVFSVPNIASNFPKANGDPAPSATSATAITKKKPKA